MNHIIEKIHSTQKSIENPVFNKVKAEKINEIIDALNNLVIPAPIFSYKKYVALLTQSTTSAPIATVLENDLETDVIWTRFNSGIYNVTTTGAFIVNKTGGVITPSAAQLSISLHPVNINLVVITTSNNSGLSDNLLNNTLIEIRIYN